MTQQKKVLIDVPGKDQIADILKKALGPVEHSLKAKDLDAAARLLEGYSSSDVVALAKEAAMLPVRHSTNILQMKVHEIPAVTLQHIRDAKKLVPPCATPQEIEKLRRWGKDF